MTVDRKYISRLNEFGESFERQHSFYGSGFVKEMIERGGSFVSQESGVTYRIPTHFGFCYGVEKSIDLAFETTRRFPDRRIFLTHDVIHNPQVNHDLAAKGVRVLKRDAVGHLVLDGLAKDDIVVIAAFGTRSADVESLKARECLVVDTTCGAIVSVWKRVEKYAKSGHTSVIHGIWNHEETQATASQAIRCGGKFIIIRNMDEARLFEQFLKKEISAAVFLDKFKDRVPAGFNPDEHLRKIGIASQTTMLKTETLEIQEYLKALYLSLYGEAGLAEKFMLYDTICSATQERQDALKDILNWNPDVILVVGGFTSSNTTHLSEIAGFQKPTYHIQGPEDILSDTEIRHLCAATLKEKKTSSWIPAGLQRVAITTGASTPDVLIEKVIRRVEECLA